MATEKDETKEKAERPEKGEGRPEKDKGVDKGAQKRGDKPDKAGDRAEKGGDKKKRKKSDEVADKPIPPSRLLSRYRKDVVPKLKQELGLRSVSEVPRLEKIVINMGLGEAISNNKVLDSAVEELSKITGQKPVITKSKKAISNFKLRENMPIGAMVTLRRSRMWEFLDRLVSVSLPRVRDFKGVSDKAFDGRGNYTLGIKEQIMFPEIDYDSVEKIRGMNISFVTTAKNDEHGKALLEALGMPFVRRGQAA